MTDTVKVTGRPSCTELLDVLTWVLVERLPVFVTVWPPAKVPLLLMKMASPL